jgi:hypothetical protein
VTGKEDTELGEQGESLSSVARKRAILLFCTSYFKDSAQEVSIFATFLGRSPLPTLIVSHYRMAMQGRYCQTLVCLVEIALTPGYIIHNTFESIRATLYIYVSPNSMFCFASC